MTTNDEEKNFIIIFSSLSLIKKNSKSHNNNFHPPGDIVVEGESCVDGKLDKKENYEDFKCSMQVAIVIKKFLRVFFRARVEENVQEFSI